MPSPVNYMALNLSLDRMYDRMYDQIAAFRWSLHPDRLTTIRFYAGDWWEDWSKLWDGVAEAHQRKCECRD